MKVLHQRWVTGLCVVAAIGLLTPIWGRSFAQAERRDDGLPLTNNMAIAPFVGKQVLVVGKGPDTSFERQGTLESFDHPWLRIRTKGAEIVCYSASNLLSVALREDAKR